jgi:hypothetical protein
MRTFIWCLIVGWTVTGDKNKRAQMEVHEGVMLCQHSVLHIAHMFNVILINVFPVDGITMIAFNKRKDNITEIQETSTVKQAFVTRTKFL